MLLLCYLNTWLLAHVCVVFVKLLQFACFLMRARACVCVFSDVFRVNYLVRL